MSKNNELNTKALEQEQNNNNDAQTTDIDLTKYVSKDDLNDLLKKARSQERDKLHGRLENQKKKAEELEQELINLKTAMENKLDVPAPPVEQEPDPDTSPGDALRLLQQRMQEQATSYQKELAKLKEEVAVSKNEALAATKAAQKAYEADKLKAYKDSLVGDLKFPDRVMGNSPEEILKSYAEAKAEEERIFGEIASATQNKFREEMAKRLPPGLQPSLPGGNSNTSRKLSATERRKRVMSKDFLDQANDRIRKLAFGE